MHGYKINELLEGYSSDLHNDSHNEKPKKFESIQQYDYINHANIINRKKNTGKKHRILKSYFTHDEKKNKSNHNNRLFNQHSLNIKGYDIYNNNKYNSLSNILKNKKMISTPVLNSNLKKGFKLNNHIRYSDFRLNDTEHNENDINGKNKSRTNDIENFDKNEYMLSYEIEKIKKQIVEEQENNIILLNKLEEEKNKNASLTSLNNQDNEDIPNDKELNYILTDIANYLQVNNLEEIIPKLQEMIEYLNVNIYQKSERNKKRNELISKLQELYISLNNSKETKEQVSIKVIWRWIKYLMNTYKSLLNEKEKKMEIFKNLSDRDNYFKECCLELMNKYKAKNLEELNIFIEELIKRNNINKKRVEQLKKILVDDNNRNNSQKINVLMKDNKQDKYNDINYNKKY
jgi:hypothetical protein